MVDTELPFSFTLLFLLSNLDGHCRYPVVFEPYHTGGSHMSLQNIFVDSFSE